MKPRIIDKRTREKFMIDDDFITRYARVCGWKAVIVYVALCRHANRDQYCFPSIELLALELNVSRPTIISGLKTLEKLGIIKTTKMRGKRGVFLNNAYILQDKSVWDNLKNQVNNIYLDQVNAVYNPSQRGLLTQVNAVDYKETHKEGNTYKGEISSPPITNYKPNFLRKRSKNENPD